MDHDDLPALDRLMRGRHGSDLRRSGHARLLLSARKRSYRIGFPPVTAIVAPET